MIDLLVLATEVAAETGDVVTPTNGGVLAVLATLAVKIFADWRRDRRTVAVEQTPVDLEVERAKWMTEQREAEEAREKQLADQRAMTAEVLNESLTPIRDALEENTKALLEVAIRLPQNPSGDGPA